MFTNSEALDVINNSVLSDQYMVLSAPLGDLAELRREWVTLELETESTFFLSWIWISTWIEVYSPNADVIRAYFGDELVSLAIVVRAEEKRFGVLQSSTIQLHQTGNAEEDQIWIEYNGFLTKERHHEAATLACLEYLIKQYPAWDELIVGAVTEEEGVLLMRAEGLDRHDLWEAPCYGIDLAKIRENKKDYLSTLSRNTRYQIKRSLRKYEEIGIVKLESAQTTEQALEFFDEIAPLHINRWGSLPGQSGFANASFLKFHQKLISDAWSQGSIDICRMTVDGKPISYFYNFSYKNTIYFYLSGIGNIDNPTDKPGLLGHSMCVQKYQDDGLNYYDFMGGGEQYKKSLGSKQEHLYKLTLQKKRLKFRVEQLGRRIKRKLRDYY